MRENSPKSTSCKNNLFFFFWCSLRYNSKIGVKWKFQQKTNVFCNHFVIWFDVNKIFQCCRLKCLRKIIIIRKIEKMRKQRFCSQKQWFSHFLKSWNHSLLQKFLQPKKTFSATKLYKKVFGKIFLLKFSFHMDFAVAHRNLHWNTWKIPHFLDFFFIFGGKYFWAEISAAQKKLFANYKIVQVPPKFVFWKKKTFFEAFINCTGGAFFPEGWSEASPQKYLGWIHCSFSYFYLNWIFQGNHFSLIQRKFDPILIANEWCNKCLFLVNYRFYFLL